MNLILTVAEVTAPVFLLAAIGWIWVKLGHEYRIHFVTQLAMTLSLPALMFTTLMQTDIPPAALTTVALAAVVAYAAVTVVMLVAVRVMRLDLRTYLAPLIFGNTGNIGLPMALFAYGTEGLGYALTVFAVMAIYSFTAGIWMVSGGGSLIRVVREPVVAATFLGALFLWQGWHTPPFLTNAMVLVGQISIPLMLITLGVAIARFKPRALTRATMLSLFKLVACAAIGMAVGHLFALPPVAAAMLTLQVATPIAVTSYLLAEKYGAEAEEVAGLVVVSTLMSVIGLSAILAFVM